MLKKSVSLLVVVVILLIPFAACVAEEQIVKKVGEDEYDLLLTDDQVKSFYESKAKSIKLTPDQIAGFKKLLGKDITELSSRAIYSSVYENRVTVMVK